MFIPTADDLANYQEQVNSGIINLNSRFEMKVKVTKNYTFGS